MSLFDDGIAVLKIAAAAGNRTAQAVIDELEFRETRITALHEGNLKLQDINSELNAQLRELRLRVLRQPTGFGELFNGDFKPGVTAAYAIQNTHEVIDD